MTSSIQVPDAVRSLATSLTQRFDKDTNGHLSPEEFTAMLTQLLSGVQTSTATAAAGSTSGTSGLGSPLSALVGAASERARLGVMAGFDQRKLADGGHSSVKYQMGRILQFYPHTPAGLRDALPELQRIVPGLTISGSKGDRLDFGDFVDARGVKIGVVDVIQAAGMGGIAWQWAPIE